MTDDNKELKGIFDEMVASDDYDEVTMESQVAMDLMHKKYDQLCRIKEQFYYDSLLCRTIKSNHPMAEESLAQISDMLQSSCNMLGQLVSDIYEIKREEY